MEVKLQYFDGCPNWKITDRYLKSLIAEGMEATLVYEEIDSHESAVEKGFHGSPTVLIDGADPFADPDAPGGLTCRVYRTENGLAGSPTIEQLREALSRTQA